ncbi:MAG: DNA methyltransferase [Thermoplasmata archaeon]
MNKLYYGDNLEILRKYIPDNSVDLIYLDPPFNSKANYNVIFREENGKKPISQIKAFSDFWHWDEEAQKTYQELLDNPKVPEKLKKMITAFESFLGHNDMMAYLVMMAIRLVELHRVLKDTGSLYFHCDTTASHYIKLILDAIFGQNNFRNEIIWCYARPAAPNQKIFTRGYQNIFFYTKSNNYILNLDNVRIPYKESTLARAGFMSSAHGKKFTREVNEKGKIPEDWWEIPYLRPNSKEFLGYPTQKPLELLERIIKASSNEGDIVLDPFCGCGTALDAAEKLHRQWIGIDITHIAIHVIKKRLTEKYPDVKFEIIGEPKDLESARELARQDRFQFQLWALSLIEATPSEKMIADEGIDGVLYHSWLNKNYRGIIQVKSGHVGPKDIRDFKGTMKRENADYGIFITLEEPTEAMKKEAIEEGFFDTDYEQKIPRIQIITIEQLLNGENPKYPAPRNRYNVAERGKREEKKSTQKIIDDIE